MWHSSAGFGEDVRVAAQVQIASVAFPRRKEETDLRADADCRAPVGAELCAGASVAGDLLIDIADHPCVNGLADKLRGPPVGMEVDAVAVVHSRVRAAEAEAP